MPYTPPTPRSPALVASPAPHTSSTLDIPPQPFSPPRSPGSGRPLPRSSVSKAQRSRDSVVLENTKQNASSADAHLVGTSSHMTLGNVGSTAQGDSGNSSDDDDPKKAEQVAELHDAVRQSMIANGVSDKHINGDTSTEPESDLVNEPIPSELPKLSESARKISHSRSSTDSAIVFSPSRSNAESPPRQSADDGSDEEILIPLGKPRFVRKKSGELVKPAIRPNMRRKHSSMPGTPTFGGKKGVHFDDDIAQVRHFLSLDRPMAVSAGGSPVETFDDEPEYPFNRKESPSQSVLDLRLANFPRQSHERLTQTVRLESLSLSADKKSLVGDVVVANLAFQKSVTARFTLDNWSTTSEVSAIYETDAARKPKEAGFDLFSFHIRVSDQANLEQRTMLICIRYNVSGVEYWDNNAGQNFMVEFSRKEERPSTAPGRQQAAQMSQSSPPRSRTGTHTPPSAHEQNGGQLRAKPSIEDEFSVGSELGSPIRFRQRTAPQLPDAPPARRAKPTSNQFASRYDFGASLSAALSSAQAQLGERSGIKRSDDQAKRTRTPVGMARQTPEAAKTTDSPRADSLLASKQPLDSRAYQEFVSKFCFFGSGKQQGQPSPDANKQTTISQAPSSQPSFGSDGANDEVDSPKRAASAAPEAIEGRATPVRLQSPLPKSREASSSPARSFHSRSTSPASITLRYSQEREKGWFSNSTPNPPAIHG